jgi:fructose-1,6-bisphosphatase
MIIIGEDCIFNIFADKNNIGECKPVAFLLAQAGGKASDGLRRIMEIEPKELDQCVPFIYGKKKKW